MQITPRARARFEELLRAAGPEPVEHEEGEYDLKDLKEAFCGEGTCGSGEIGGAKFATLDEGKAQEVVDSLRALNPKWPELWKKTTEKGVTEKNPMTEKLGLLNKAITASVVAALRAAARVLLHSALEDTPMYTYRLSGQPKAKPAGSIIKTSKAGTVYVLFHNEPEAKELAMLGVKATKVGEPSGDQIWETISHAPT